MVKIKPRTNAVCRSVMFRAITIWNTLPTMITEAPSKASFKRLLNPLTTTRPFGRAYFFIPFLIENNVELTPT